MRFYKVLPRDNSYRPDKPLTYAYDKDLKAGTLVSVPLKHNEVIAVVLSKTVSPNFDTKKITTVYSDILPLPKESLDLISWLNDYYPGSTGAVIQQFIPKKLTPKIPMLSIPINDRQNIKSPSLSEDQKKVLEGIKRGSSNLIHGDTGTGKTRVYIEMAAETLKKNKSVLVLTPEISLTSQLTANFKERFGSRVILVHSGLSDNERLDSWIRVLLSKEPVIVLGPRSALFSPFTNLGLIVLDEEHEEAYKQEQSPHYHALRVASKLASLYKATLIMGSATPSVADYYVAESKHIPILRMEELPVNDKGYPLSIKVADLSKQNQSNRNPYFSDELVKAMTKALNNKEQILLFLNRRGTSRIVLCENCGWRYLCPRCDLPLVYHADTHNMRCHTCGFLESAISSCPVCHKSQIVFKGIGTKALTELVQKIYPDAVVKRFDTDNKKSEKFEQNYTDVKSGKIDILVGTQTIVKGLDLPRLSVVGVVLAESSLLFPDYTSSEKTYQLLTQVIGRVGRGHRAGEAIIQTYSPSNSTIKAVVKRNYLDFYQSEIKERQEFLFPPFCFLLKLSIRRATKASAKKAADNLVQLLQTKRLKIQILGPMPSFYEKVATKFQWQIVVKTKERQALIQIIKLLPSGWSHNIDPSNLL